MSAKTAYSLPHPHHSPLHDVFVCASQTENSVLLPCLFAHHKLRIPCCSQGLKELGKALQKGDIPAMIDLFVSVRNAMHVHKRQGEKVVYPTLDHMNAQVRNDTDSRSISSRSPHLCIPVSLIFFNPTYERFTRGILLAFRRKVCIDSGAVFHPGSEAQNLRSQVCRSSGMYSNRSETQDFEGAVLAAMELAKVTPSSEVNAEVCLVTPQIERASGCIHIQPSLQSKPSDAHTNPIPKSGASYSARALLLVMSTANDSMGAPRWRCQKFPVLTKVCGMF